MPWSDNPEGGSGGANGNGGRPNGLPGGRRPNQPPPPDLEAMLRGLQERLARLLGTGGARGGGSGQSSGGGSFRGTAVALVVAVVVAVFAFNEFTFGVNPDELGIVLRFGAFDRQVQPGLNFRLPYPLETVQTPKVTRVSRVTIGQVADERAGGTLGADVPRESLMLTGDENIVDIDFTVFWIINDAKAYLFNMERPENAVKAIAESAMREAVGRSDIQPLLTGARQAIEDGATAIMQKALDAYGAGISITQVQLLKVDPPAPVIASFRDVQAAQADQAKARNVAQSYANNVIPAARGQSAQIVAAASAYRDKEIAEATGEADRFVKIYDAYKVAPAVTRERLYLETLEQVFAGMQKVIIDNHGGNAVVPYLGINDLLNRPPTAATAPVAATRTPTPGLTPTLTQPPTP